MTFWDHLEELRHCLLRSLAVTVVFAILAFIFKDEVFAVVFAPKDQNVQLINTELTSQFMTHMMVSFYCGIVVAAPYILYEMYKFISPALYQNERRYATRIVGSSYIMFMLGTVFCYFVVFPFTFRFLGNYQAFLGFSESAVSSTASSCNNIAAMPLLQYFSWRQLSHQHQTLSRSLSCHCLFIFSTS